MPAIRFFSISASASDGTYLCYSTYVAYYFRVVSFPTHATYILFMKLRLYSNRCSGRSCLVKNWRESALSNYLYCRLPMPCITLRDCKYATMVALAASRRSMSEAWVASTPASSTTASNWAMPRTVRLTWVNSRWRILSRSMSIKDNEVPSSSLPPTWVTPAPYICVRAFLYSNPANDITSDLKHNMAPATWFVCLVYGNNVLLPPSSCRLMPKD